LADATGLTVRTLHHYEQVGLLSASGRTEGGHRLYDEAAVEQLYRIRLLRRPGLSLDDIGRSARPRASCLSCCTGILRASRSKLSNSRTCEIACIVCAQGASFDPDDVIATIEAMSTLERHVATRRPKQVDHWCCVRQL
jgi:DNA-binding transcriptional MerR regulator